jgi:ABC-type sugar transport system ATPase subunit
MGRVVVAENLGGDGYIHTSLRNGLMISVRSRKSITEEPGSLVNLSFYREKCYLFDKNERIISGVQ